MSTHTQVFSLKSTESPTRVRRMPRRQRRGSHLYVEGDVLTNAMKYITEPHRSSKGEVSRDITERLFCMERRNGFPAKREWNCAARERPEQIEPFHVSGFEVWLRVHAFRQVVQTAVIEIKTFPRSQSPKIETRPRPLRAKTRLDKTTEDETRQRLL
ncbi:hypothetical protein WMY93_013180 [Mugilogobius chulae]|uniref:Uncharacterized protein n=1 Tax=Mugilogobius chulae TaxID=88201 RepID=A0AAW0PAS1_9GOBI